MSSKKSIEELLVETGERDRLKEMLRAKLVESGWRDNLKEHCKEVIKSKGKEKVTVDELAAEITPHGRSTIPQDVKQDLLRRIAKFAEENQS
ncbi:transcription factor e(y)2-domain-containing protein [Pavlovales sp. CCMP2436]|nr:transcription factor e(y)2-domain-containing protein [Pavlovales sp. CCMP2436]